MKLFYFSEMNNVMPLSNSSFGFRNIKPRTRRERLAANDKTATEKLRLEQRVGQEARQHRSNAPETSAGLTSCTPDGAGYIKNADRFHSDTAGEDYEARQAAIERRNQIIQIHQQQVRKNSTFVPYLCFRASSERKRKRSTMKGKERFKKNILNGYNKTVRAS